MRACPLSKVAAPLSDCVEPLIASRELVVKLVAEHDCKTFEDIEHILRKKQAFYQQIDHSARLDLAYISWINNVGAKQRLESLVLGCLPSESQAVCLADSLAQLQAPERSAFATFLPKSLGGLLAAAKEMVAGLQCELAPKVEEQMDEFMDKIVHRSCL